MDAALVGNLGHHANVCRHITGELRRRGITVDILANARVEHGLIEELNASPAFHHYPYAKITSRKAANFHLARVSFIADFSRATRDRQYDLIYASSVLPAQMAAVILWAQTHYSAADMPPIAFELGLPSGVGGVTSENWGRYTRQYRSAARRIRKDYAGKFLFFTFDEASSGDYSKLLGFAVDFLPPAYAGSEVRLRSGDEEGRPVVGFLGQQRPEKGYHLIPDVLRRLADQDVGARFLIHNGVTKETALDRELRELAAADSRIRFDQQPADKSYWNGLLDSTDIVVLPYEPSRYAASFSAIAAEAVSCGLPMVCPQGTTMKTLAERYQNNPIGIAGWTAEAVADAISDAVRNFPELARSAYEGADRWAIENGAQVFASRLLAFADSHATARPTPPAGTAGPFVRLLASVARVKMKRRGL